MPKYQTKQREILLDYLETIPGEHFTAGDICEYFKSRGTCIGQSTIYRQLEELVDEGLVNKFFLTPADPACFEYIGKNVHHDGETCFHCECEKCGKLIHLHCDELVEIQTHLLQEHSFMLNPIRPVFYGLCESCRNENADRD